MTDDANLREASLGHAAWASRQTRAHAATVLAPLDSDEAEAAVRAALDAVIGGGATPADRLRAYPPRLRIEKPGRRDAAPRRLVQIRLRDAGRGVVHEISVVDGAVVEHVVNEHGDPPFTDEELASGRSLLARDSRFADILADPTVELEWFNPGHGERRLLGVRLVRVENTRVIDVVDSVVVDLDNDAIMEAGDLGG